MSDYEQPGATASAHPHSTAPGRIATCEVNGTRFSVYEHDFMGRRIISGCEWEPHIRRFCERFLRNGDTVVDCGAAFGVHTITAARCVAPGGRVLAFEPQRAFYDLLVINCRQNGIGNVQLYHAAVAQRSGHGELGTLPVGAGGVNMGDVFLVPPGQGGPQVPCLALDNIGVPGRVRLIKLDVQGLELAVLSGAQRMIARHRPHLLVEIENFVLARYGLAPAQVYQALRELGYEIFFLDYEYPCDHVCVPLEERDSFRRQFRDELQPLTSDSHVSENLRNGVSEQLVLWRK